MRRSVLSEYVAGKMVAPHEQRHLQFDARRRAFAGNDDVIRRAIFETVRWGHDEVAVEITDPEAARIEKMRTQVRKNASLLVAPRGLAHKPSGTVSVKHSTTIDPAQNARPDQLSHAP